MMRKKSIILFLSIFMFNFLFSASYDIDNLLILGKLLKNGSMEVTETITYDIGEINGIIFNIDTRGYGDLEKIQIYEDKKIPNGKEWIRIPDDKYEIVEQDGIYRIKVYSRNVNTVREFKFVYLLPNAVKVFDDVAQLNRKMVGKNWQSPIKNVEVEIEVPVDKNYDNSKIMTFGHGPLTGEIDKVQNRVFYKLKDYYPGEFVETNILMEPSIFTEVPKKDIVHKNIKEEILLLEKRLAEDANRQRDEAIRQQELYEKSNYIFGIEAIFFIALIVYIRLFSIKKLKIDKDIYGEYLREKPDNYSPAVAGTIVTGRPNQEEILATLVDFIRRKILILEKTEKYTKLTLNEKNIEDLSNQEKYILSIYINDFGNGEYVVLEELKGTDISLGIAKKFEKWRDSVEYEIYSMGLDYIRIPSFKRAIFTFLGFVVFISAGIQASYFDNPLFVLLAPLSFGIIITTNSTRSENEKLQQARARWNAFRRFLSDYSLLSEANITAVDIWEEYFVYAIAMGVSENVVKAYKRALDMGMIKDVDKYYDFNSSLFYYYALDNGFSNLRSRVSYTYNRSLSEISHSRRSSFSGGGGGFSSGSSGGGGGAGGGGAF